MVAIQCNSVTAVVINGFSFTSYMVFDADSFQTQVSCARCLRNFQEESSVIASISSNSSLVNIWPSVYFSPPLTIMSVLICLQSVTSMWTYNALKFMLESFLFFSCRATFLVAVMHEQSCQCVSHQWHFIRAKYYCTGQVQDSNEGVKAT